MGECLTCGFFDTLFATKTAFVDKVYWAMSPAMIGVTASVMILWVTIGGGLAWMRGEGLGKFLISFGNGLFWYVVATVILTWTGPEGRPLVYYLLIDPLEETALSYAQEIVKLGYSVTAYDSLSGYGILGSLVENQMKSILQLVGVIIESGGGLTAKAMRIVAGILILLPYLFVWGVFAAFLVEAMFKFVAAGIVSPLVIPAAIFKPTRSVTIAMVRILIGAFFTIIFAAGAMGFTMKVVDDHASTILEGATWDTRIESAQQDVNVCREAPLLLQQKYGQNYKEVCNKADENLKSLQASRSKSGSPESFTLWSPDFFVLFVIGFVSVLLHLQAKSLASNISGANDGAGPAAATVAAGKMLLGAGIAAGSGALFGKGQEGGAFNAARNLLGDGKVGQAADSIRSQGVIGAVTGGFASLYSGGVDGGDGSSPPPSSSSSSSSSGQASGFGASSRGSGGESTPLGGNPQMQEKLMKTMEGIQSVLGRLAESQERIR